MTQIMARGCAARVSESVGLWVDVHLDIYVSKRNNIRPLHSQLRLPWTVACAKKPKLRVDAT